MALTGFQVGHQCAPNSGAAILLLQADYPQINNSLLVTVSSTTFTAPSTFTMTMKTIAINTTTNTLATKAFALAQCDPAIPIDTTGTIFDPVLAGAVWMFALTMVLGVWVLAKNAGIIINMVKRW